MPARPRAQRDRLYIAYENVSPEHPFLRVSAAKPLRKLLVYSVSATGLTGRSTNRVILPRLPASAPPGLGDHLAEMVASRASGPSDRRRGYWVSGELFPTMALGVELSYLSVDYKARASRDRSDTAGLSVEWFFRRNVSANVLISRTRIDNPISPLSGESDAVSVRVRVRL